jgi:AAA family ATP:ADP antiporter
VFYFFTKGFAMANDVSAGSRFSRIIRFLWGDLSREEYKKFGILAAAMMLIIGNYWMLRVAKDAVFELFVGYKTYVPIAKMISPLFMLPAVLGYSKLVDLLKRSSLIYVLCTFYGVAFIALSYFIAHPDAATISSTSLLYPLVSWIPGRGLGWFLYLLLESYGSIIVGLFFAFIASVMTTDLAKKGYGFLFVFIQLATVIGILIEMHIVKSVGFPSLYFLGGVFVLLAPFVIRFYLSVFAHEVATMHVGHQSKKENTGFFEGARLIVTHPYVMGLFVVASFYEVIHTIIEYQMGVAALSVATAQDFAVFKGVQGLGVNILSFIFSFFGGTSIFMRKFGIKFCLIAFPVTIGAVVAASYVCYVTGMGNAYLMWVFLGASVVIKGLNYALNKPTSEVLYVPTSKDVKFKSKGWVDMFGLRAAKSVGGGVNLVAPLLLYGTIASFGVIAVWVFVAAYVGTTFNKLQAENKIIE